MPTPAPPPSRDQLRFALPPSLGAAGAGDRAAQLQAVFEQELGGKVTVSVASSYELLAKDLLSGRIDVAWAPPFVCARVEAMGVRVLVRGVRNGASTYRAALVARAADKLSLEKLDGKVAAWVDRDSVAGHLLPMALLRSRGVDPAKALASQSFAGSYKAAAEAVLEGRADLTSTFAVSEQGVPTGLTENVPDRVQELSVVAFTDEAPNDGVAVSMSLSPSVVTQLEKTLLALQDSASGAAALKDTFHMDRFEAAPRLGYRALYRVALASL